MRMSFWLAGPSYSRQFEKKLRTTPMFTPFIAVTRSQRSRRPGDRQPPSLRFPARHFF